MSDSTIQKLVVCLIVAFDRRRMNEADTPFLAEQFESNPWAEIRTFPTTETVASLLTGLYPHELGYWHVQIKKNWRPTWTQKLIDQFPDFLTTTAQCIAYLFNQSLDLATIPSRRRRRFELKRYKYNYRGRRVEGACRIGGRETIIGITDGGKGRSSYRLVRKVTDVDQTLRHACSQDYVLEFLELRFVDNTQHWNLHNRQLIRSVYGETDRFVSKLHEKCREKGYTLLLVSNHGQEEVRGTINLKQRLKDLDLSEDEYSYFLEVPMVRFWFHSDRARNKITECLSKIEKASLFTYKEMSGHNVNLRDDTFGEAFLVADPGHIFFPHDFYHPLVNLFMGLIDREQRARLFNPMHKAVHGYLPDHPSEKGFMLLLDNGYQIERKEVELIDFAPSMLGLLGYEKPEFMKGKSVFRKVNRPNLFHDDAL